MKKEKNIDDILESEFSEDVLDLKNKLKVITVESSNKKSRLIKLLLPVISVAAILVLAIIFLPSLFTEVSSENIYSSFYEPYPMALNQRGDGEASLNEAINNYSKENFEEAAKDFKLMYNSENDLVFLLYAATSEQASENYLDAIQLYDQIIDINDPIVREQALWYKGLALLKLNKMDEAKSVLESIDKNHYKYLDAKDILNSF